MDDEHGLELSLGLASSGSSAKLNGKGGNTADTRTDEGDRGSKVVNDFKRFLLGYTPNHETRINFGNSSKAAVDVDTSTNSQERGSWAAEDKISGAVEKERVVEACKKSELLSDDVNQKKRDREDNQDLRGKTRSHISINTDDGSTAENEDVADSEVEGSTSRVVSRHEDSSKTYIGAGSLDLQGQKKFKVSPETESKHINMSYGVNGVTFSGYRSPMQVMAGTNNELPKYQSVMPGNLPSMFGYSPIQLPMLENDNSSGLAMSASRGTPSSEKSSDAPMYDAMTFGRAKIDNKQHATGGSSSQIVSDIRSSSIIYRAQDASNQPKASSMPSEYPAIRPGIAADLKFGGCGSYPNLPWVSTKGLGSNGRTISGVTYKYSATEIRIVCACHGSHMSPEEFVRHACEEQSNQILGSV